MITFCLYWNYILHALPGIQNYTLKVRTIKTWMKLDHIKQTAFCTKHASVESGLRFQKPCTTWIKLDKANCVLHKYIQSCIRFFSRKRLCSRFMMLRLKMHYNTEKLLALQTPILIINFSVTWDFSMIIIVDQYEVHSIEMKYMMEFHRLTPCVSVIIYHTW